MHQIGIDSWSKIVLIDMEISMKYLTFGACCMALSAASLAGSPVTKSKPAFDCSKASSTVEEMICADPRLGELDQELTALYKQALKATSGQAHKNLKAYQRGWIKGRNDCWKADEIDACVYNEYYLRINELKPNS